MQTGEGGAGAGLPGMLSPYWLKRLILTGIGSGVIKPRRRLSVPALPLGLPPSRSVHQARCWPSVSFAMALSDADVQKQVKVEGWSGAAAGRLMGALLMGVAAGSAVSEGRPGPWVQDPGLRLLEGAEPLGAGFQVLGPVCWREEAPGCWVPGAVGWREPLGAGSQIPGPGRFLLGGEREP